VREKRAPDPETQVEVPGFARGRKAHIRPGGPVTAVPGTAAYDVNRKQTNCPLLTVSRCPSRTIRWRPSVAVEVAVVVVFAVLHPFPYIPRYLIETPRIGLE
jgi:hypothetical protein